MLLNNKNPFGKKFYFLWYGSMAYSENITDLTSIPYIEAC